MNCILYIYIYIDVCGCMCRRAYILGNRSMCRHSVSRERETGH